jgi:crotonobetainyl-CoA:carnitine CoA-transferase CaiB-like acyl-CoA transferase
MLANLGANFMVTGKAPGRMGNAHANIVPYQVFEAADGHLILAVGNDGQFAKFAEIAGHAEWVADPRFATNAGRVRHREQLVPEIAAVLKTRPRDAWLAELEAAKVPGGPINNLAQAFADPQAQHRQMRVPVPHPDDPGLHLVASPLKLSATPVAYRHAPPLLGQHSHAILRDAGLSEAQIDQYFKSGAVT